MVTIVTMVTKAFNNVSNGGNGCIIIVKDVEEFQEVAVGVFMRG